MNRNVVKLLLLLVCQGPSLCMNPSVDAVLLQMVQQHVHKLIADVDKMVFAVDCDRETVKNALEDVAGDVKELEKRVSVVEKENKGLKRNMKSFQDEQRAMGGKFNSIRLPIFLRNKKKEQRLR